jgi:hypothetical protein
MCSESLDGWSVHDAWKHVCGDAPQPRPEDFSTEDLCDVDEVVASYFGDTSIESRRKAHAAVAAVWPRISIATLRPMPRKWRRRRFGYLATRCVRALKKYKRARLGERKALARIVSHPSGFATLPPRHWFMIWDALGSTGENVHSQESFDFYKASYEMWRLLSDCDTY